VDGRLEIVVSELLLLELDTTLGRPSVRKRIATLAADLPDLLREHAIVAPDPWESPPARSRDPADDYMIALSWSVRAALVSGDQDLLALSDRLPVYSPRDFLDLLEARR
jgi:predicted nucleic acid-binding protein